jgi:hypothetical protein
MSAASPSSTKKTVFLIALLGSLALTLYLLYRWLPGLLFVSPDAATDLQVPSFLAVPVDKEKAAEDLPFGPVTTNTAGSDLDSMVEDLAQKFQRQLSLQIHLVAVQVSLKTLRDDLRETFPEQGDTLFERIITRAFPEFVAAILQAIALMDQYETWLQGMLLNLNDMNAFEQQGVLWAKRRELFGDAANQIWQAEISAEQERQLTMRRTMEMLDKAYGMQMQERLYLLKSNFEESYADKLQNMVVDPKGVLAQVFFGLDAVQKDLAALTNEERQNQINDIRKSMGFSDEHITRLAEADQEREQRWQNGYAYMTERRELEAQFSGDELTAALDTLRDKYFAHEATTIKKEEEELQFFRYERPRVYGRN